MQLSSRHKKILALAGLILTLGAINYYLFQNRILFFNLFSIGSPKIYYIQNKLTRYFITGYFSDITWCCALYFVTIILAEIKYLHLSGKVIILLLPFFLETAQYFHLLPGTFDWYDMLTYLLILIIFLKLYPSLRPFRYAKQ